MKPSQLLEKLVRDKGSNPVMLHLGCGRYYLEGYINIDIPGDQSVSDIKVDIDADLRTLQYPPASIDQVRIHHVFEHFNRVEALALLIKWHLALKKEGSVHIITPDAAGIADVLSSNASSSFLDKQLAIRHLVGSHEASWGYHLDAWSGERFKHTCTALGFVCSKIINHVREDKMRDVEVWLRKDKEFSLEILEQRAVALLKESAILPIEQPLVDVWVRQLSKVLSEISGLTSVRPRTIKSVVPIESWLWEGNLIFAFGFPNKERVGRWVAKKTRVLILEADKISFMSLKNYFQDNKFVSVSLWHGESFEELVELYGHPKYSVVDKTRRFGAVEKLVGLAPYLSFWFSKELVAERIQAVNFLQAHQVKEFNLAIAGEENLFLPSWVSAQKLSWTFEILDECVEGQIFARRV